MTPEQRTAFDALLSALNAYLDAHGLEVDRGGTIRSIRAIGSASILKDMFRTDLTHFERKKWPVRSKEQIASADALLSSEYEKALRRLQRLTKDDIDEGAVKAGDLPTVQKTWLKYRDAWVAFAGVRYPDAVAQIRTEITLERYRLLKTIP